MIKIPISDAKTHLLKLIRDVMAGQSFAITKGGRIVAKVVSPDTGPKLKRIGFAQVSISDDISPIPGDWSYDSNHFVESLKPKRKGKKTRTRS